MRVVEERAHRDAGTVRQRQEVEQAPDLGQGLDIVGEGAVGDGGLAGVRAGAAEILGRHDLSRHGLHHVGAGDEHVGRPLDHEDEVGHRGRVDGAAGAGTHDDRDLRDHARRHDVALEHLGVAGERGDALLDTGAARVVEADHGGAVLHGHVHHLADLLRVRFGQRAAEDGEVLGEHVGLAAVDRAPAGHHAVARGALRRHAEVGGAVRDEHVELLERALVEQQLDPFARGQLALLVLRRDALLSAAEASGGAAGFELVEDVLHGGLRLSLAPGSTGQEVASEPAIGQMDGLARRV